MLVKNMAANGHIADREFNIIIKIGKCALKGS